MVKVGCCGFPVKRERYYEFFRVVEVQKTFYMPPEIKTLKKWRDESPEDFEFVVKAWQLITHPENLPTYRRTRGTFKDCGFFRDTECVHLGMEKTLKCAEVLKAKVIIFQTPASFREKGENIENIINFFGRYRDTGFLLGWEHRGRWSEETLKTVYRETGVFEVVDPFKNLPLSKDFIYFRLHGKGGYKYRYTEEDLEWLKNFKDSEGFIMFNNVYMFEDAKRFLKIVQG